MSNKEKDNLIRVLDKEGLPFTHVPFSDGEARFFILNGTMIHERDSKEPQVDGVYLGPDTVAKISDTDILAIRGSATPIGFKAITATRAGSRAENFHSPKFGGTGGNFTGGYANSITQYEESPAEGPSAEKIESADDDTYVDLAREYGLAVLTGDSSPISPEEIRRASSDLNGAAGIVSGFVAAGSGILFSAFSLVSSGSVNVPQVATAAVLLAAGAFAFARHGMGRVETDAVVNRMDDLKIAGHDPLSVLKGKLSAAFGTGLAGEAEGFDISQPSAPANTNHAPAPKKYSI